MTKVGHVSWLPGRRTGIPTCHRVKCPRRPDSSVCVVSYRWYTAGLRLPVGSDAAFVAFAGRALHEHPGWRTRIAEGDREALSAFVHEVRRLYPFVPVLAARAGDRQDVLGVAVARGGLVVLDVHGTDHDPATGRIQPVSTPAVFPLRRARALDTSWAIQHRYSQSRRRSSTYRPLASPTMSTELVTKPHGCSKPG
jgi:hypothetical protein